MAVISAGQVKKVYASDVPDRFCLYIVSNVSAGDTLNLGPTGASADFQTVKQASMLATTVQGTATCTVAGTTVTMPAGLANDAGYLSVWGATN